MTFTDLVIILFILALLAYAIYDQFIMPRRTARYCWPSPCFAAVALTA
ncbi:membrane protein [Klebsiella pneumoniae]|nr:membrane protein [Klebsiella pneumoniae]